MSEIRCPMCGRVNPENAETCQYCEARLKPVWEREGALDAGSETGMDADEFAGWLFASTPESPALGGPEGDEAIPDWLKGLREDAGSEHFPGGSSADLDGFGEAAAGERELPEWLKDIVPASDAAAALSNNKPDLAQFQDEDPDWVRRIDAEARLDLFAGDPKTPQWDELETRQDAPAEPPLFEAMAEETAPLEQTDAPDLPAWLSPEKDEEDIWQFEQPAGEQPSITEPSFDDLSLMDLSDHEEGAEEAVPAEYIPDWLTGFEAEGQPRLTESAKEAAAEEQIFVSETEPISAAEEVAAVEEAGLAETDDAAMEKPAFDSWGWDFGPDADLADADQGGLFDNDLSWLEKLDSQPPQRPLETSLSQEEPLEGAEGQAEQPDDPYAGWLSQIVKPETEERLPAFSSENGQEAISTADLPSWLKAMRPMGALDFEGQLDRGEYEQPEKAGPLAGLVGALPAEPEIVRSVKPPEYALKPHISEVHAAQARMLAELLAQEGSANPLPHPPIVKFQSVQRISIGLILFVVILFSLLAAPPNFSLPAVDAQVFVVNQLVSSLPPGAPVLGVIDYSPGFSGEVAVNLEAVLAHIHAGGGHLALVSTTPLGPLQAEQLMHSSAPQTGGVDQIAYANLGFIPGGQTGVLAFARDPRGVIAFDTRGENAWDDAALSKVNSIRDFSLILVASENPDTVRMWIEQTQPLRGNAPMVVISSAQNEPVVRPYYDSYPRQIQGLLGGLSASAQYETLSGRRGPASSFWPTFLLALTIVIFIILVGAAVNASLGLVSRKSSMKRVEEKG